MDDTPAHAGANYGKPRDEEQPHNLCSDAPGGSDCPIHNFMNYVDDDWMKINLHRGKRTVFGRRSHVSRRPNSCARSTRGCNRRKYRLVSLLTSQRFEVFLEC